ncbi:undecaprenyl-diphosphate phosphatase [Rhodobacteraceae bacterium 2376]|uniref:Undecaprenyl-diphosphatase n=1 Tax=Rhabdonatronobacter sediminivivens TaxID=2743469 RepID=A0A7Z0I0S4_9RHOB|nr:undecaprenyl-diphosphate phosphatase [Rhabdonatronobacter sediminivivens]NYS25547.1 undecaprenyl-diphosphate phosphatase [Rhabdonatronobacter sediminivivens]
MSFLHIFMLAVIQGLTEFLPVSSSGHLILLPALTNLEDQGLVIDVAVHVGTLFAVCWYFRADVALAVRGVPRMLRGQIDTQGAWLALCLTIATIPVVIAGLIFHLLGIMEMLRSVAVIGWAMIIFGIVLYLTDRFGTTTRNAEDWSLKHALYVGLWQAVALIPGTSRSGITISGLRAMGYNRHGAAKVAMLMSIPTIIASGGLMGIDVVRMADWQAARDGAIAAFIAFFAAWAALVFMMKLLRTVSFTPYVIYRLILGSVLLVIAYS